MQDWERVIVFQKSIGDSYQPQYCFKWERNEIPPGERPPKWKQSEWKRVEEMLPSDLWNYIKDKERFLIWKTDLWNEAFIPNLSNEEKQRYSDIRLAFEYPKKTIIPKDSDKRKILEGIYTRQQLDILQGLIQKVRARRSALRTAAVAIMSRNMSHNIGSHVLARLTLKEANFTTSEDKEKHINKLIKNIKLDNTSEFKEFYESNDKYKEDITNLTRYLQERMDFLAEISTTQPYVSLPTSLPEVIEEFNNQEFIISYITGIIKNTRKPLQARVEIDDMENEVWFASPGGRLGYHALYIILENVIRNSAKHQQFPL